MGRTAYQGTTRGDRSIHQRQPLTPDALKEAPPVDLFILKTWLESMLLKDDRGASMVEYGLLVALIAVIAIVAVKLVGTKVSSNFSNVGNSL